MFAYDLCRAIVFHCLDTTDRLVMLNGNLLHPLHIGDVVNVSILVDRRPWNQKRLRISRRDRHEVVLPGLFGQCIDLFQQAIHVKWLREIILCSGAKGTVLAGGIVSGTDDQDGDIRKL